MKLLHMVSGDPLRTPTIVSWNEPNAWVQTGTGTAVSINPAFAWMHGGIQPEIAQTWLGFVGPGVKRGGIDDKTWTDHTDVRPTMLALLGQEDDYPRRKGDRGAVAFVRLAVANQGEPGCLSAAGDRIQAAQRP